MDQKELAAALKPNLLRLKQIGAGIKVGKVLGSRVLVKTVVPRTDLDRVEEEGLLFVPKHVKTENTPLPTTGIVIQVGPGVSVVTEGDMVMFPKFAGCDFKIENEDFRVVEEAEVMCTLVDTLGNVIEVSDAEEDSLS